MTSRRALRRKLQGAAHRAAPCRKRPRIRHVHRRRIHRRRFPTILWPLVVFCAAGITVFAFMLSASHLLFRSQVRIDSIEPWPEASEQVYDDGFPKVDWEYWRSVNPDVIGWITVSDTVIDYPIVQAHAEDPDYYLDHNVYGEPDYRGCPYLDASCETKGFDSKACYIYGHHLDDGTMFSEFAGYSDREFAEDHHTILLQSPDCKYTLDVLAVDIVDASAERIQNEFLSDAEYRQWAEGILDDADLRIDESKRSFTIEKADEPDSLKIFVTCSYNFNANERTLCIAA